MGYWDSVLSNLHFASFLAMSICVMLVIGGFVSDKPEQPSPDNKPLFTFEAEEYYVSKDFKWFAKGLLVLFAISFCIFVLTPA